MSFVTDIYVFICMGFVLLDLFDEWVCSFYHDDYISGEDLGFWLFNVKYMVNIIFIDYLELVEILNCLSWRIL